MPHYDYICDSCKHQTEVFQKISEQALTICSNCQKTTFRRKPGGGAGLHFRGTGFYETDYNSKNSEPKTSSTKSCCPCKDSSCSK